VVNNILNHRGHGETQRKRIYKTTDFTDDTDEEK
jgi:hypothetical protein